MKWFLISMLGVAALITPMSPSLWAREVSRLNQDVDNRPHLQPEQTAGGHTSAPGVNVQQPQPAPKARRRPARASKAPPRFPGPHLAKRRSRPTKSRID